MEPQVRHLFPRYGWWVKKLSRKKYGVYGIQESEGWGDSSHTSYRAGRGTLGRGGKGVPKNMYRYRGKATLMSSFIGPTFALIEKWKP